MQGLSLRKASRQRIIIRRSGHRQIMDIKDSTGLHCRASSVSRQAKSPIHMSRVAGNGINTQISFQGLAIVPGPRFLICMIFPYINPQKDLISNGSIIWDIHLFNCLWDVSRRMNAELVVPAGDVTPRFIVLFFKVYIFFKYWCLTRKMRCARQFLRIIYV